MNIYTFIAENPISAFFLALILAMVVTSPFRYAFLAYNRTLRSRNIVAHGWPPEHCDADGDFQGD